MQIDIAGLHFTYPGGVTALAGVSLSVAPGEQVAIIGQNGSGKTTLVKHLNGLLQPSRGTVRVGDWLTSEHSVAQLAARVGYVFQNPDDQLFKTRVDDEVRVGPLNLKLPPEQVAAQTEHALALLGLLGRRDLHPYDLTPAWRKRVAIAAVVAMNTPIVVLDEPTTGQDYATVQELGQVLAALHAEGKTLIAISHDIDFVASHFDRIVVMGQGKILADGDPATVFAQDGLLASTYVEPPQMTRLAARLALGAPVYSVQGFVDHLSAQVKRPNPVA
jgi:energy-coupling factor transport system ATP-binding protein